MTNPVQVTQDEGLMDALAQLTVQFSRGGLALEAKVVTKAANRIAELEERARLYEAALQRLADQSRMIAERGDRIAELEAAVTRLTLALEMERGRGQPRAEHDRSFPDLGPSGSSSPECPQCARGPVCDVHFEGYREIGEDEVERVAKAIEGPHLPVHVESKFSLEHLREVRWARLSKQEQGGRLSQARAALAALTPARTYQEGIEDAAKELDRLVEESANAMGPDEYGLRIARKAIRSLGTKP